MTTMNNNNEVPFDFGDATEYINSDIAILLNSLKETYSYLSINTGILRSCYLMLRNSDTNKLPDVMIKIQKYIESSSKSTQELSDEDIEEDMLLAAVILSQYLKNNKKAVIKYIEDNWNEIHPGYVWEQNNRGSNEWGDIM